MPSEYAAMSKIAREPMRRWWRGTGSWLLLGLAVLGAIGVWLMMGILGAAYQEPDQPRRTAEVFTSIPANLFVFGLHALWYLAASQIVRALRQANPAWNSGQTKAAYLLCLRQGVWPLAIAFLMSLSTWLLGAIMHQLPDVTPSHFLLWELPYAIAHSIQGTLGHVYFMLWLIGILVLSPKGLAIGWGLQVARLAAGVIFFVQYSAAGSPPQFMFPLPGYSWVAFLVSFLGGGSILFAMLHGLAEGKAKLVRASYWLLLSASIGSSLAVSLYFLTFRQGVLQFAGFLSNLVSPSLGGEFLIQKIGDFVGQFLTRASELRMFYLHELLELVLIFALFAIIYRFLLGSRTAAHSTAT